MSSGINGYARLMLGLTSRDNSGAFRCYRVSKLAEIDLDQVRSRGYSFQEEILFWCQAVGCRIGETPIVFKDRRAGVSKINMREAVIGARGSCSSSAWRGGWAGSHRSTAGASRLARRASSRRRRQPAEPVAKRRIGVRPRLTSRADSRASQAISRSRTVT